MSLTFPAYIHDIANFRAMCTTDIRKIIIGSSGICTLKKNVKPINWNASKRNLNLPITEARGHVARQEKQAGLARLEYNVVQMLSTPQAHN